MGLVGDVERGVLEVETGEEGTSAHSDDSAGKRTVFGLCDHEGLLELEVEAGRPCMFSNSGVRVKGVVDAEGAVGMMERGGRILKIWSSDCGGPYESNGSGTDCNMGSITGSDLEEPIHE